MTFQAPFTDTTMKYDFNKHRYILTTDYVRQVGIELGLSLDSDYAPEPSKVPELVLERISLLVYSNIYQYGRNKEDKEYLLACKPELRDVIRDAMTERLRYMIDSGDLSTRSGALITQGTRVEVKDLVAGVVEEMILRPVGLLHRGDFFLPNKDKTLLY
jgi:hypothetical protein